MRAFLAAAFLALASTQQLVAGQETTTYSKFLLFSSFWITPVPLLRSMRQQMATCARWTELNARTAMR